MDAAAIILICTQPIVIGLVVTHWLVTNARRAKAMKRIKKSRKKGDEQALLILKEMQKWGDQVMTEVRDHHVRFGDTLLEIIKEVAPDTARAVRTQIDELLEGLSSIGQGLAHDFDRMRNENKGDLQAIGEGVAYLIDVVQLDAPAGSPKPPPPPSRGAYRPPAQEAFHGEAPVVPSEEDIERQFLGEEGEPDVLADLSDEELAAIEEAEIIKAGGELPPDLLRKQKMELARDDLRESRSRGP